MADPGEFDSVTFNLWLERGLTSYHPPGILASNNLSKLGEVAGRHRQMSTDRERLTLSITRRSFAPFVCLTLHPTPPHRETFMDSCAR